MVISISFLSLSQHQMDKDRRPIGVSFKSTFFMSNVDDNVYSFKYIYKEYITINNNNVSIQE
jgi:hypothetical protein